MFSKPAEPGRVKTRLHSVLTPQQAAELHQAFLDDLIPRLTMGAFDLEIAWAVEADEPLPEGALPCFRQRGGDLGERLFDGLARVGTRYSSVCAIGSDYPELSGPRIEEGFRYLEEGADVAIGPADDGGYYLLGLRSEALTPSLFAGLRWGTREVFEATLERCRSLDLEVSLLPLGHDVDLPRDLDRLEDLIQFGAQHCPNTERVLRSWGRLS